ncbi:hypothetical protein CPB85DRAFT_1432754 [Mucidula mucida]|nr:hypothetical protein CPB85DRAFT_1432754 [Mucidula mucida]
MASIVLTPPPTTNWLTMRERAQLRRKAKKLGQLLGSVPHVIDGSEMSRGSIPFDLLSSSSTLSSVSSGSSRPSTASSTDSTFSSLSRATSLSSYDRPESRSSLRARRAFSGDSWPKALPLLRLSKPSPSLRSIPGSPAYPADTHYLSFSSALSSSDDEDSPTFKMPSPNASRRRKMDKLRRTLGDGVPLDLVFPAGKETVPPPKSLLPIIDIVPPSPVTEVTKDLPPIPATRHSSPRDSMSFPSPHKARRMVRRKPVPVLIPTRAVPPPPPPPPMSIEELERAIDEDMRRLFDIIEDDGIISDAPSEGRWSIVSPREDLPHTSS